MLHRLERLRFFEGCFGGWWLSQPSGDERQTLRIQFGTILVDHALDAEFASRAFGPVGERLLKSVRDARVTENELVKCCRWSRRMSACVVCR